MRKVPAITALLSCAAFPLLAGALLLEPGTEADDLEARQKGAALVVRTTACHAPEETTVTATAEGNLNGLHKSIALKTVPLSTPGAFGIFRAWPQEGQWSVKIVATNPEYRNYASGMLVPVAKDSVAWASVKRFSHAPTTAEVDSILNSAGGE